MASPRPKPAALREREAGSGNRSPVSHRRLPARVELARPITDETPPDDLPREARAFWRDTVVGLIRIGLITEADREPLMTMCGHLARLRRAERTLAKQGSLALGSTGQPVAHPAVKVAQIESQMFLRYAIEFGITPSARVGLGLTEAARRTLQMDLEERLGPNPRRTPA